MFAVDLVTEALILIGSHNEEQVSQIHFGANDGFVANSVQQDLIEGIFGCGEKVISDPKREFIV